MKKFKLKVSVVSYEEKEVYADNEEEAYEKIYDSINKVGDLNCNSKAKVESLEYFNYEVLEEKIVEDFEIKVPIIGYYTANISAVSIEEAYGKLKDKAIDDLYDMNETNELGISELKILEKGHKDYIDDNIIYSVIKKLGKEVVKFNDIFNNKKITVIKDLKDTKYENSDRKMLEDITNDFE
jgi:hypothetical protein